MPVKDHGKPCPKRRSIISEARSQLRGTFSVFRADGEEVRKSSTDKETSYRPSTIDNTASVESPNSDDSLESARRFDECRRSEPFTGLETTTTVENPPIQALDQHLTNDLFPMTAPAGLNTFHVDSPINWVNGDPTSSWTSTTIDLDSTGPPFLQPLSTVSLQIDHHLQTMNNFYPVSYNSQPEYPHFQGIDSIPRQLDTLPVPSQQRNLINHWVMHLCDKLMPVRSIVNPFLSVVSPMALEGSRMARERSSSTVALFHAVCAASAAHQANIKGSPELTNLSHRHTNLSVLHLTRNIHSMDANERLASLGTLCVWLATHHISGTIGVWREVVKVVRNLLEQTAVETWTQSASASITYQCYAAFIPLVQSQYLGHTEFPGSMKVDLMGLDIVKSQAIPQQSLELISSFNSKLLQGLIIDTMELDRFEIEFALSTPPLPNNLDFNIQDHAVAYHHSSLFYQACLLYFRSMAGRREPEHEMQDLVMKCLEQIERLDTFENGGSPRTWIYAIVAFEANTPDSRDRVRASFARRKSLAFATWDTLLLAAEEVWKRRDETLPEITPDSWPQVLADLPHLDVLWY